MKHHSHIPKRRVAARRSSHTSFRPKETKKKEYIGTFIGTRRGFGFVTPDGGGEDIFVPADSTLGAMDGDRVCVAACAYGGKTEGRIIRILQQADPHVIGVLGTERIRGTRGKHRRLFLIPDNRRLPEQIFLWEDPADDVEPGHKVEAMLMRSRRTPTAKIIRSFGPAYSFDANYEAILAACGIEIPFSHEALQEAERVAARPVTDEGRTRYSLPVLTIDAEDAKDLDDAVSLEQTETGYLLGVHIADVSSYVEKGGALNHAVMQRGTSVYFVDQVVPMLPPCLSNGACSLNAGQDKYTLSAFLSLSPTGKIIDCRIRKTVICSDVRGVYSEVNDLFANREQSVFYPKYQAVYPMLMQMHALYRILKQKSLARGYLELERAEPHFVLDQEGFPTDIRPRTRADAEEMIEQFMLAANEGVATLLHRNNRPCIYRVHEVPPPDKLTEFSRYVYNLGLSIEPLTHEPLRSLDFAAVLQQAKEQGKQNAIAYPMLRTMAKAHYSEKASAHFGLGMPLYCHFTSPIRRLSDLITHRLIHTVLLDGASPVKVAGMARKAAVAATQTELAALSAERQINDLYAALWASRHIGEEWEASVTSVVSFGMFAMLDNTCEGLISMDDLPFGCRVDEKTLTLSFGETSCGIADRIRVCIADSDLAGRRVLLRLLAVLPQTPSNW